DRLMAISSIPRSVPRSPASTLRRNPSAAWRHLDVVLLGCVAGVAGLGVLIGLVVLALTVAIDYRHFRDWSLLLYGASCALLLFVVSPLGSQSNGAQS